MRNSTTSIQGIWKRMEVFFSFCFLNCHCRNLHWHVLTQRLLKELQYREQFFITGYSIQNANTNSIENKSNWPSIHEYKMHTLPNEASVHPTTLGRSDAHSPTPTTLSPAPHLQSSYCSSLSQCCVFPLT